MMGNLLLRFRLRADSIRGASPPILVGPQGSDRIPRFPPGPEVPTTGLRGSHQTGRRVIQTERWCDRFQRPRRGGSQWRLHSRSHWRIAEFSDPPEAKRRKFYIADGNFKERKTPSAGRAAPFEPCFRPGCRARIRVGSDSALRRKSPRPRPGSGYRGLRGPERSRAVRCGHWPLLRRRIRPR